MYDWNKEMKKFIILMPLYNDWKSVSKLLKEIDLQVSNWDSEVSVILVNDASTEEKNSLDSNYQKIKSIKILNMKKNRVHQRCIAAGLNIFVKMKILIELLLWKLMVRIDQKS